VENAIYVSVFVLHPMHSVGNDESKALHQSGSRLPRPLVQVPIGNCIEALITHHDER
jgi:hypothetical protein